MIKKTVLNELIEHIEIIQNMNKVHIVGRDLIVSDAAIETLKNLAKKYLSQELTQISDAYTAGHENGVGCTIDSESEDWCSESKAEDYLRWTYNVDDKTIEG